MKFDKHFSRPSVKSNDFQSHFAAKKNEIHRSNNRIHERYQHKYHRRWWIAKEE